MLKLKSSLTDYTWSLIFYLKLSLSTWKVNYSKKENLEKLNEYFSFFRTEMLDNELNLVSILRIDQLRFYLEMEEKIFYWFYSRILLKINIFFIDLIWKFY